MKTADRDELIAAHTRLADTLARAFSHRYSGLIEPDDAVQTARLALVRGAAILAAAAAEHPAPTAYLRLTINGCLQRYLRDQTRLVRVSRRAHESGVHPLTHDSLDALDIDSEPYVDSIPAPASDGEDDVDSAELAALVDRLPANQAAIVRLRVLEGLTIRQTAAQLCTNHSMVHRLERRAFDTLRADLTG